MNTFQKQLFEAASWTFLETFLVTLGPSIAVTQVGDWHAIAGIAASAVMAAGAATVSMLKSKIIKNIGTQDSIFISGNEEAG